MTLYLDTSALAKLLVVETESSALTALVARQDRNVTSTLTEVELMRLAHRIGPDRAPDARAILDSLHTITLSPPILRSAANLLPGSALRSLDAIHLATAAAIPDLTSVCTYDARMISAARQLGLRPVSPT